MTFVAPKNNYKEFHGFEKNKCADEVLPLSSFGLAWASAVQNQIQQNKCRCEKVFFQLMYTKSSC